MPDALDVAIDHLSTVLFSPGQRVAPALDMIADLVAETTLAGKKASLVMAAERLYDLSNRRALFLGATAPTEDAAVVATRVLALVARQLGTIQSVSVEAVLQDRKYLKLLQAIARKPGASNRELAEESGYDPRTVSIKLAELAELQAVTIVNSGRRNAVYLNEDAAAVIAPNQGDKSSAARRSKPRASRLLLGSPLAEENGSSLAQSA